LSLAINDAIEIIGKHSIEEFEGPVTYNARLTEVRDIEEPNAFADSGMFSENSGTWIFNRHEPSAKIGHLRLEVYMLLMQR
jgi:hypothetical protein